MTISSARGRSATSAPARSCGGACRPTGDIYLDNYAGWYSVRDEAYYDESELKEAAGRQKLSPQGTPVEWVEEESYFFRLSAYQDKLLAHYEAHPEFIGPDTRANEVKSFVRGGLQDLSISRTTFDWGIPVPGNPKHIMYVWVDALTNYLTGVGFPDEQSPTFKRYWPAEVHIIGKDIIRFHAVYWPAFLMSAGVVLPKRVFGHGFLYNRGEKMSKSVGNVVDPFVLAGDYGVDQLRYFLLREVPFGQDGNYSREGIVQRINADLANDLGNLAQRALSMIAKNCGGMVPAPGEFTEADKTILAAADGSLARVTQAIDDFAIHRALEIIWSVIADANRYFAGEEPWAHKKTNPKRMETILYVTAEALRRIAILVQPIMPDSAGRLLDQLGVPPDARDFSALKARMKSGTRIAGATSHFPASCPDGGESGSMMSIAGGKSGLCWRQSSLMRASSTPSTTTPPITVRGTAVSPNRSSMMARTPTVVASRVLYLIRLRARMSLTCLQ